MIDYHETSRRCRPDKLLPVLLSFDQGAALEAELGGGAGGMRILTTAGLAGRLLARTDFFEAATASAASRGTVSQRPRVGVWELAQKAQAADGLADAMMSHLVSCGLVPRSCQLGTVAEEGEVETVGMRDLGANTPAAPSSVRLTSQLPSSLLCSAGEAQVVVPLGGAADAVILARHARRGGGALPLLVTSSLWQRRSVLPSRLPETTVETDCTLSDE